MNFVKDTDEIFQLLLQFVVDFLPFMLYNKAKDIFGGSHCDDREDQNCDDKEERVC